MISRRPEKVLFYTSYYGNTRHFPKDSRIVKISNSSPYSTTYELYSAIPDWDKIVKPFKYGTLDETKYEKLYRRQLNKKRENILGFIRAVQTDIYKRPVVFTCYEKETFCHRHIFSKWLNENGIECKEL